MNSGPDLNSRKHFFIKPHNLRTFAVRKRTEVLSHIVFIDKRGTWNDPVLVFCIPRFSEVKRKIPLITMPPDSSDG